MYEGTAAPHCLESSSFYSTGNNVKCQWKSDTTHRVRNQSIHNLQPPTTTTYSSKKQQHKLSLQQSHWIEETTILKYMFQVYNKMVIKKTKSECSICVSPNPSFSIMEIDLTKKWDKQEIWTKL